MLSWQTKLSHNFPLLKLKQRSFDEVAILHNTRDETGLAAYLINAGTSIPAQGLCCYTMMSGKHTFISYRRLLTVLLRTIDQIVDNATQT